MPCPQARQNRRGILIIFDQLSEIRNFDNYHEGAISTSERRRQVPRWIFAKAIEPRAGLWDEEAKTWPSLLPIHQISRTLDSKWTSGSAKIGNHRLEPPYALIGSKYSVPALNIQSARLVVWLSHYKGRELIATFRKLTRRTLDISVANELICSNVVHFDPGTHKRLAHGRHHSGRPGNVVNGSLQDGQMPA
jgi:hypothetical protein